MTTPIANPHASVSVAGVLATTKPSSGSLTLDSRAVPYASGSVTLPLVDLDVIEDLDPRIGLRATVTAGDTIAGTSRSFDLALRGRPVSHDGKTITLALASDEAILQDYASLTVDKGARAHEASVRAVCNYVLGKIGAVLAPGTDDANVTAYWAVTNLVKNPVIHAAMTGWFAANGNSTLSRSATGGPFGEPHGIVTASAAGDVGAIYTGAAANTYSAPVTAGSYVVGSMYARASASGKQARVVVRFSDGTTYYDVGTANTPITNTGWTRITVPPTRVPAGFTQAAIYIVGVGLSAGQALYFGSAMLHEGTEVVPVFVPGYTPPTSGYTYVWAAAAHDSVSTRIPVNERLPELFTWAPGITAWEFLETITASVGLKLWCDESRVWRLTNPATHIVPGMLSIAGWNATEGTDDITLDDPEVNCTGVVIVYEWRDSDGIAQTATDAAGTPGKVLRIDREAAYPGPGLAAAVLARRAATGRVQDVTALADWTATPGMRASISLPGTVDVVGQLAAITWGLSEGLMQPVVRGLTDIIPGSIDALVGTIDALVGTIDSL
jgi:hypothetical protein